MAGMFTLGRRGVYCFLGADFPRIVELGGSSRLRVSCATGIGVGFWDF